MGDDHVAALLKAREKLVQQRRSLATSLGDDHQRGHIDDRRSQFIEVQQALEAMDRAIDDERALSGTKSRRSSATIIHTPGVRMRMGTDNVG